MVETFARHRFARISAQKARLVVNLLPGLSVEHALKHLKHSNKKAAGLILKVLNSAIANAENNFQADVDLLRVKKAFVDEARGFKRLLPRAKGRANYIKKRTSHITLVVSDQVEQ